MARQGTCSTCCPNVVSALVSHVCLCFLIVLLVDMFFRHSASCLLLALLKEKSSCTSLNDTLAAVLKHISSTEWVADLFFRQSALGRCECGNSTSLRGLKGLYRPLIFLYVLPVCQLTFGRRHNCYHLQIDRRVGRGLSSRTVAGSSSQTFGVASLFIVEIQNLEGCRQSRHLQCCSLRAAYHQALVFHRNESQTKCCLAVTSTTHAWQSKAIFFVWRDIVGAEHHNCQHRALYVFTKIFLRCESK